MTNAKLKEMAKQIAKAIKEMEGSKVTDHPPESGFDLWKQSIEKTAYDKQLTEVLEWLGKNLCNYDTDTDSGFFWPQHIEVQRLKMSRLLVDLEKAMRPT